MSVVNIKTNYNRYNRNEGSWWTPYGGQELFAGNLSDGSYDYATVLGFDISAYASYTINGITLYLYRYDDGQAASKTWSYQVGSAISGGSVTAVAGTSGSFTFSTKNAWKSVALSAAAIAALKAGNPYILLIGANGQYAGIRPLEYSAGTYAAYLRVDYTSYPTPTAPKITAISTVTADTAAFDWSDSADGSGFFSPSQLDYEVEVSKDGGASWLVPTPQPAVGSSLLSVNLRGLFGLQPKQYWLNSQCKVRVRAVTPLWPDSNGQQYRSAWTTASFTVDYRIAPSAPTSLIPMKNDAYEGETVVFTVGQPVQGNTHSQSGSVMMLIYQLQLEDGTALATATATVSTDVPAPTVDISYPIGNLTTGLTNRAMKLRVRAVDEGGQAGPWLGGVDFTVKRFQKPSVSITSIDRYESIASVHILITDTGYGGTPGMAQISKVQFKLGSGAYADAVLEPLTLLDTSFTVEWLTPGDQYSIAVKAINNHPPELESFVDLESAEAHAVIPEHLPTLLVMRRSASAPAASRVVYAQAIVVGEDPDQALNEGCLHVLHDIDAGGVIRQGGRTVLDTGDKSGLDSKVISGTPGSSGRLGMWNGDGDLVDSGISAANGSWNVADTVTWTNNWADYGGSYLFGYTKDNNGVIRLRGLIKSGTIGSAAFTLPSGYRPSSGGYYPCTAYGYGEAVVRILSNGEVMPVAGSPTWISLSGISFR